MNSLLHINYPALLFGGVCGGVSGLLLLGLFWPKLRPRHGKSGRGPLLSWHSLLIWSGALFYQAALSIGDAFHQTWSANPSMLVFFALLAAVFVTGSIDARKHKHANNVA